MEKDKRQSIEALRSSRSLRSKPVLPCYPKGTRLCSSRTLPLHRSVLNVESEATLSSTVPRDERPYATTAAPTNIRSKSVASLGKATVSPLPPVLSVSNRDI